MRRPAKKDASGEHVLEALQASMGDLTERCAVLKRERADLYMRHTGLLEEIRDLRAYKKAKLVGSQPSKGARSSRLLSGMTNTLGTLLKRLRASTRVGHWRKCASAWRACVPSA